MRVLRRARPIRHARYDVVVCRRPVKPKPNKPLSCAAVGCSARGFARGAGASSRRPAPNSAPYFHSLDERLYAQAKTPAQNTFRFAISGDPYLFTPEVSDTTVQYFRPQGAYLCDARWASAGNVTRVVAGVNDVLRYRWITGEDFEARLTPSDPEDPTDFYDIYRLNADLQRAMRDRGHYITTANSDAPQFLLRLQFDVRSGRIVVSASVFSAFQEHLKITFADETTRAWLLAREEEELSEPPHYFPQLLESSFAATALGFVATAIPATAEPRLWAIDPHWALPVVRTHLTGVARVTSNTPVIPHFYSNRAFAVSGGSVDASLNHLRHQVNAINTASAAFPGSTGPALARALVAQTPWTSKHRFQNPRTLCNVNCKLER